MVHAELAVSLARDADRVWEFGFVHYVAAVVPALRGDWETAGAHVADGHRGRPGHRRPEGDRRGRHRPRRSWPWPAAISEGVTDAAAAVRAMGKAAAA